MEESMLSNCGAEKTIKSHLDRKIKPVNPKGKTLNKLEGWLLKLQNFGHLMRTANLMQRA